MKKSLGLMFLFASFSTFGFDFTEAQYKLVEGDQTICETGPARIIKTDTDTVFALGSIISIPLIKNKTTELVAGGQCTQVDELVDAKNKIVFTSSIHSCSKKYKKLEKKIVQTVSIEGDKLQYQHTVGKVIKRCLFQKDKL